MKTKECPKCGGDGTNGSVNYLFIDCPLCDGTGVVWWDEAVNNDAFIPTGFRIVSEKPKIEQDENGAWVVTYVIEPAEPTSAPLQSP